MWRTKLTRSSKLLSPDWRSEGWLVLLANADRPSEEAMVNLLQAVKVKLRGQPLSQEERVNLEARAEVPLLRVAARTGAPRAVAPTAMAKEWVKGLRRKEPT